MSRDFFTSGFSLYILPVGPIMSLAQFRIFSNNREDIRHSRCTTSDNDNDRKLTTWRHLHRRQIYCGCHRDQCKPAERCDRWRFIFIELRHFAKNVEKYFSKYKYYNTSNGGVHSSRSTVHCTYLFNLYCVTIQ